MPFALSPGVTVIEKDFSSVIPAVSTSTGAAAGAFQWGPVLEPTTITSEDELVRIFGRPTNNSHNYLSFFTAANFLSYTNNVIVNRVDNSSLLNASAGLSATAGSAGTGIKIRNNNDYSTTYKDAEVTTYGPFVGKYPGTRGNGIQVILVDAARYAIALADGAIGATPVLACTTTSAGTTVTVPSTNGLKVGAVVSVATLALPANTTVVTVPTSTTFTITPQASFNSTAITSANLVATATFSAKTYAPFAIGASITISSSVAASGTAGQYNGTFVVLSCTTTSVTFAISANAGAASTQGAIVQTVAAASALNTAFVQTAVSTTNATIIANFSKAPGTSAQAATKNISNDELHALVMDSVTGHISGTASQVLEKYEFMSKLKGVVRGDGTNLFWRTVINAASKYVLALSAPDATTSFTTPGDVNWGTHIDAAAASAVLDALISSFNTMTLTGGVDATAPTDANYQEAFLMFADTLNYDISLLALGAASPATANAVIAGVAETRKDCIVFVSPGDATNGPIIATGSAGVTTINTWKSSVTNSSYVVMDSGWKYQYDRYNDEYRWIPLNADMAGLCARTDYTADPWFSPGGFTRGQVKNVIKLGFNPGQAERDSLYNANVNPVVTFPGQGTILFGDKTFTSKPSAFDRINVRRLFIVLEKSISIAAKFQLFELNDAFTRAQFKNLIEPFLRNVQGRRGITDFVVKCDTSNNTGDVIDANQFVASIFIKPNRSINFITLNFVAARSSVNFSEIGG